MTSLWLFLELAQSDVPELMSLMMQQNKEDETTGEESSPALTVAEPDEVTIAGIYDWTHKKIKKGYKKDLVFPLLAQLNLNYLLQKGRAVQWSGFNDFSRYFSMA